MLRSEEMGYYNLIMPRESAWHILNQIGNMNALHFLDMQSDTGAFNRPFYNQVKRCDDLLHKIDFIEDKMKQFGIEITVCEDTKEFVNNLEKFLKSRQSSADTYLQEVEDEVDKKFKQIEEQQNTYDKIKDQKTQLFYHKQVLQQNLKNLSQQINLQQIASDEEINQPMIKQNDSNYELNHISGIINKCDLNRFQRIIFRAGKGNVFSLFNELETISDVDNIANNQVNIQQQKQQADMKLMFTLIFSGGFHQVLSQRILKVCDSFGAQRFSVPKQSGEVQSQIVKLEIQLKEQIDMENLTKKQLMQLFESQTLLRNYFNCCVLEENRLVIEKEKMIYKTMNLLQLNEAVYFGYCYIPTYREYDVINCLSKIDPQMMKGQLKPLSLNNKTPPTFFKLNDFTFIFQLIVNTYGVPRYREINPGLFTIMTFPFLFAVMFADLFHGSMLFIFAAYLVINANKISSSKSFLKPMLIARYLLFFMGIFAIYNGLIYNDFTSINIDFFGSCYKIKEHDGKTEVTRINNCVYSFGLDPIWSISENEIAFTNSLKMKISVILGFSQMMLGIFLKGANSIYFKKPLEFIFEFIPQIVFMTGLFGYMNFMIIYKWSTDWSTQQAPGLIQTLITIPLSLLLGQERGLSLWGTGNDQKTLENTMFIIILLCVPLMLFPKPMIEINRIKKQKKHDEQVDGDQQIGLSDGIGLSNNIIIKEKNNEQDFMSKSNVTDVNLLNVNDNNHGHDQSGEIFVHQVIETIEFVLGSISNTASYLRLWALSLAHGQLSAVFFNNAIKAGLTDGGNIIILFIGYAVFFGITFGVLMVMDTMECFLHAIRLHWVEFQNKFYKSDGYQFEPFSFQKGLIKEEAF